MNDVPTSLPAPTDAELADYLAGGLEDGARHRFEAWVAASPDRAYELAILRTALGVGTRRAETAGPAVAHPADGISLGARLRLRAERPVPPTLPIAAHGAGVRGMWMRGAVRWGTAVVGAIGVCVSAFAIHSSTRSSSGDAHSARVYETQRAQRATVTLPSGLRITLAPESRVVATTTSAGVEIALTGEAVFDVQHRASQPVLVHAGNTLTKVLGTTFGVRYYPQDATVRVAVREGRVAMNALVLSAGEIGTVSLDGRTDVAVGARDALSWTDGALAFRGAPLRDVAVELSRWFSTDILVADAAVGRLRVTGRFTNTALTDVLSAIASATGARVARQGDSIVFHVQ